MGGPDFLSARVTLLRKETQRAVQSRKGSRSMSKITKYVGLDVHKDSISIAVAEEGETPD